MLSTEEILVKKLEKQDNPRIVFADLDGTIFSPNLNILKAPFVNRKTALHLKSHDIPFVITTGRSDWNDADKRQISFLGFSQPDSIITANGTVIYHQLMNRVYSRDMEWESLMHYSKVKWADGKIETWNKLEISNVLRDYFLTQSYSATFGIGNTFLIRIRLLNIPYVQLEQIRKDILTLFSSGVRVVYTEKLLKKNTSHIFSGELLITPKLGGKDNAVKYLLEKYAKQTHKAIHAFIFGDATVDIPMLTLHDNPKYYTLSQYLVHPTTMAKKAAENAQKSNSHLHILEGDGPEAILNVIEKSLHNNRQELFDIVNETKQPQQDFHNKTTQQSKLSPAQNNPIRKIVRTLEPLLDRIVDKNLSPNEVSFLGLTKLQKGLNQLYSGRPSTLQKISGLYNYGFGNLTDVLDGIRARNSDKKEENGQLVDGFSDRAKEFMQLFIRARQRLSNIISNNTKQSSTTFLTAISCTLPSIARAQAEILGKVVSERDEKGGSMIDRTKKLSLSLLMDTIGARKKSEAIDQQIYSANIATFQNRLRIIGNQSDKHLALHPELIPLSLSDFQKKALERWLLYIDVLQQEDSLIRRYLSKYPHLLDMYEKDSQKLAKDYLTLQVNKIRKKWNIKDYKLQLKNYF